MPVRAFDVAANVMGRAQGLHTVAGTATGVARDDILRSALALGVASLDAYLHSRVLERAGMHARGAPNALGAFKLTYASLEELATATVAARKRARAAGAPAPDIRPMVRVKRALAVQLRQMPLQSYDDVGKAMAMSGTPSVWKKAADATSVKPDSYKTTLTEIVQRRNRIVHEGDLRRLDKPRTIALEAIDAAQVQADLLWLGALVDLMEYVANT